MTIALLQGVGRLLNPLATAGFVGKCNYQILLIHRGVNQGLNRWLDNLQRLVIGRYDHHVGNTTWGRVILGGGQHFVDICQVLLTIKAFVWLIIQAFQGCLRVGQVHQPLVPIHLNRRAIPTVAAHGMPTNPNSLDEHTKNHQQHIDTGEKRAKERQYKR